MAPAKKASVRDWEFQGGQLQEARRARGFRNADALAERMQSEPGCARVTGQRIRKLEGGFVKPDVPEVLALEAIFRRAVRRWYRIVIVDAVAPAPAPAQDPDPIRTQDPEPAQVQQPEQSRSPNQPLAVPRVAGDAEWERKRAAVEAATREAARKSGEQI